MKINYACGRRTEDGWYNVDAVHHPRAPRAPDLLFTLRFNADGSLIEQTPLPDGCADVLMACHVLEHFFQWEASHVLAEWRRLLKPGGLLVLELPDIYKAALNMVNGPFTDQMVIWPLFGDQSHKDPLMCHKFGYTHQSLTMLLSDCGFTKIAHKPPQTHGKRANRDMRIEARTL